MNRINLKVTNLKGTSFIAAEMNEANLKRACIGDSLVFYCKNTKDGGRVNMAGASLKGAIYGRFLNDVVLSGANLDDADLMNFEFNENTLFDGTSVNNVKCNFEATYYRQIICIV